MPSTASHSLLIDLPREQVWSKLRDLTLAAHYVPDLTGCQLHPGPERGLGASRRVLQKNGQWLDETVSEWHEGEGFLIRLHRGAKGAPAPFREAWFRYAIAPAGERTRFTASLIYQPAGGVLGRLLDHLLLRR
ncbi:MAG: SRPBCC family protein, partial [Pseudomonas sp.]